LLYRVEELMLVMILFVLLDYLTIYPQLSLLRVSTTCLFNEALAYIRIEREILVEHSQTDIEKGRPKEH